MSVILAVGLGNPGQKYKNTRHNLGFRVLDMFQKENNFPDFKLENKFNSLVSEGKIGTKKILLAKPQTFMNKSGQAVLALMKKHSAKKYFSHNLSHNLRKFLAIARNLRRFENLLVVHDDVDLPLGKIRISEARGAAGHKGVESIIREIGAKDFIRIRAGIRNKELGIREIDKFVLGKFTKDEEKIVREVIKKANQALKMAIEQGQEKAMSEFN